MKCDWLNHCVFYNVSMGTKLTFGGSNNNDYQINNNFNY